MVDLQNSCPPEHGKEGPAQGLSPSYSSSFLNPGPSPGGLGNLANNTLLPNIALWYIVGLRKHFLPVG